MAQVAFSSSVVRGSSRWAGCCWFAMAVALGLQLATIQADDKQSRPAPTALPQLGDTRPTALRLSRKLSPEASLSLHSTLANVPENLKIAINQNPRVASVWDVALVPKMASGFADAARDIIAKCKIDEQGSLMFAWMQGADKHPHAGQLLNCALLVDDNGQQQKLSFRQPQAISGPFHVDFDAEFWEKTFRIEQPPAGSLLRAEIGCNIGGSPYSADAAPGDKGIIKIGDSVRLVLSIRQSKEEVKVRLTPAFKTFSGMEVDLTHANIDKIDKSLKASYEELENRIPALLNTAATLRDRAAFLYSEANAAENTTRSSLLNQANDAQRRMKDAAEQAQTAKRRLLECAARLKLLPEVQDFLKANSGGVDFQLNISAVTGNDRILLVSCE